MEMYNTGNDVDKFIGANLLFENGFLALIVIENNFNAVQSNVILHKKISKSENNSVAYGYSTNFV